MKPRSILKISVLCLYLIGAAIFLVFGFPLFAKAASTTAANANPTWYVDAPILYKAQAEPYDHYSVKDPTIVYSGGKYHMFYTGANASGGWQTLYSSATTLEGFRTATHTYMSSIGETYFCAPEVFYFEPQGLWYLIYQDGTYGGAYATSTNVADPNSWSGPKSFGTSGNMGWDYYVICDDTSCYMYNTPDDNSRNIYVRQTSLANFPTGWGAASIAVNDTFEAVNIYKSLADGQYYLVVEDYNDNRYYELWTSSSAGGPWTKVAEKWAWHGNLVDNAAHWTDHVSHGDILRAGVNQKLEINDINRVDFLIQGSTNVSGEYQQIPWDLGVIHNYSGPPPTSTPTITPGGPTLTPSLTPTRTLTPTITNTPVLGLEMKIQSAGTESNSLSSFNLQLTNTGLVSLSNLSWRLYFTTENGNAASGYTLEKYYDQSGVAAISGPTLACGSTYYYTVSYGATTLPVGSTWAYNTGFHLGSYASTYDASNDWWHTGYAVGSLPSAFALDYYLPGYVNGSLLWGNEPNCSGGTVTSTPTSTFVATNTPTRTPTRTLTPAISNTPTRTPTQTVGASPTRTLTPAMTNTPTRTPTRTLTPAITNTPTRTPTRTLTPAITNTPTRTPTRTLTPAITNTPTRTLTPTSGTPTGGCSPVTSTITAPFTFDGAGTFCWQSSNLGAYINSWNTTSVTINGVNATNIWMGSGSYPAKTGGFWYISYNSSVAWGHFEAK